MKIKIAVFLICLCWQLTAQEAGRLDFGPLGSVIRWKIGVFLSLDPTAVEYPHDSGIAGEAALEVRDGDRVVLRLGSDGTLHVTMGGRVLFYESTVLARFTRIKRVVIEPAQWPDLGILL